jgi:Serine/Threonine/Tyrosine Kinase found in polyvalent proteins
MKNIRYELQYLLKSVEPIGSTSLIKATQNFLSRNETTSSTAKTNELFKDEEEKQLIAFIQQNNLFIDFNIDENQFIAAGAEQRVYHFDDSFVIKINDSIFYLLWKDYLNNLLLHNYFFPATAYELLGFYILQQKLFAVVKQPFIKATQPTDLALVKQLLTFNGFLHKKNNDYFHPEIGLILEDLHDENVLMQNDIPYFIDTVFYLMPSFF